MRRRAAALVALLVAAAVVPAAAPAGAAERPTIVHRDGDTLYAAWRAADGAVPGARAVVVDARGGFRDTLVVVWSRDAIAALRPARAGASLAALPLAGFTGVALDPIVPGEPPPPAGVLRVALGARLATVDPLYVTTLAEKQVATQLFEGLVRCDATLAPRPALATAWRVDERRHVFTLRSDARFASGAPIRARDVAATLERALSPAVAAPRVAGLADAIAGGVAYRAGRVATLAGVRVLDSLTVEITASRPRAPLLAELAGPAAFVVPAGTPPAALDERAVLAAQSGPFRLTGASDRATTLLAAPGRRGGPAALDFVHLESPSQAAVEFELGRLDVVAVQEAVARRLRGGGDDGPTELTCDEAATYYLGFDTRRPFLADRERRRVLAGLVDRALAVRVLVPGRGRPAAGLLPPVFGVEPPAESAWAMPRADAERRARAVLGAQPPTLSFWIPAGSEVGRRLAEFVASAWRRVGLRVEIVERPWPAFEQGLADGRADAFYLSWFADGPDPLAFVAAMVESTRRGAGGNRTYYANPVVDRALEEARTAATPAAATAALRRAEVLALADAPLVPLFHSVNVSLVRPGVRGLVLDPLGAPRYDQVEVR